MVKIEIIERTGVALFGADWQSRMAREHGIVSRTIRMWLTGQNAVRDDELERLHALFKALHDQARWHRERVVGYRPNFEHSRQGMDALHDYQKLRSLSGPAQPTRAGIRRKLEGPPAMPKLQLVELVGQFLYGDRWSTALMARLGYHHSALPHWRADPYSVPDDAVKGLDTLLAGFEDAAEMGQRWIDEYPRGYEDTPEGRAALRAYLPLSKERRASGGWRRLSRR